MLLLFFLGIKRKALVPFHPLLMIPSGLVMDWGEKQHDLFPGKNPKESLPRYITLISNKTSTAKTILHVGVWNHQTKKLI